MAKRRGKRRSGSPRTAGRPFAGPAPLAPDELVYGNAAQLRRMAETLRRGDPSARGAAASASAARVRTFQANHPDADLPTLVHRPICETPDPAAAGGDPVGRSGRIVVAAADDADEVDIWVEGYITNFAYWDDEVSASAIRAALEMADGRPVRVHMNSGGGDYFEGIAIYRALRDYDEPVYVAIDALAASAASVVAMGGDRVGIGDGAFIMIHQASAFAYGNAEDLMATAVMLDVIDGEMTEFYGRRGNPDVDWDAAVRAETWYGPAAAIEVGLADERLGDTSDSTGDAAIAALFDPRPAASDTPPTEGRIPLGDPEPDPDDVDWDTVFDTDPMELLL